VVTDAAPKKKIHPSIHLFKVTNVKSYRESTELYVSLPAPIVNSYTFIFFLFYSLERIVIVPDAEVAPAGIVGLCVGR
jgi:hypothetical protein